MSDKTAPSKPKAEAIECTAPAPAAPSATRINRKQRGATVEIKALLDVTVRGAATKFMQRPNGVAAGQAREDSRAEKDKRTPRTITRVGRMVFEGEVIEVPEYDAVQIACTQEVIKLYAAKGKRPPAHFVRV